MNSIENPFLRATLFHHKSNSFLNHPLLDDSLSSHSASMHSYQSKHRKKISNPFFRTSLLSRQLPEEQLSQNSYNSSIKAEILKPEFLQRPMQQIYNQRWSKKTIELIPEPECKINVKNPYAESRSRLESKTHILSPRFPSANAFDSQPQLPIASSRRSSIMVPVSYKAIPIDDEHPQQISVRGACYHRAAVSRKL